MVEKTNKPKGSKIIGQKPKPKETKAQTFKRIAEPRVKAILSRLRILGNCSNRNNYEYTQEQIANIESAISKAFVSTMSKFTKSKKEQESFEL